MQSKTLKTHKTHFLWDELRIIVIKYAEIHNINCFVEPE